MQNVLTVQTKREVGHAAVFVRRVADKMTDEQIRGLFK